jgi:hypothetical protein
LVPYTVPRERERAIARMKVSEILIKSPGHHQQE